MTERLRGLPMRRRHPRSELISRYLEDDLDLHQRAALDAHLRGCGRCREVVRSLREMVAELATMRTPASPQLAQRIVAELHADEDRRPLPRPSGLRVVASTASGTGSTVRPARAWTAVRFCLRRTQIRVTVPIALLIGIALSVINQGSMLFNGPMDVGMCAMCGANFLLPFAGLNIALLVLHRRPSRRRR